MAERQRFRRVRRRTVEIGALRGGAMRSKTLPEQSIAEETDDRIPELEKIADRGIETTNTTERRKSVKREAEDNIPVRNKRRSLGSSSNQVLNAMSLLDSPLLEQNDILQPLVETTGTRPLEPRIIKKARRRRSIAVIKEFENETPTKQFNGLKDMLTLTPETDDEQAKQNKDTKKEMSYSRPTDQTEWMTVKEIFCQMKKEAHEKSVPIPSYTEHMIQDRHRQILIEWLIEVATEEKYRRTTFYLAISILDRYLHQATVIHRSHLQTIGTAALLLAAKLEEVVPPDIWKLVDFGDGAVELTHLVKVEATILHILKWKINSVTPLQFLLFYLQSPCLISNKPSMPQFNELLLYYAATILDISRLDSSSYKYPFHIISAAILTRLLDFIELDPVIQANMQANNAPFSVSSSSRIKSFIQIHVPLSETYNCLEYVTPIIITLMNDLRCRITENKSTAVPTHRQAHGCQHENARLQSNLAGEQGSVDMLVRSNQLREQLIETRRQGGDKRARLLAQHNIPSEFVKSENDHFGHQNKLSEEKARLEPISPS